MIGNGLRIGIVGGGVAGLFSAWYLAQMCGSSAEITLLEKGKIGRGTSWDAAGMLAPVNELEFQEIALFQAGIASRNLYDTEVEPGLGEIGLRREGTVEVGLQADDTPYLKRLWEFQLAQGQAVDWLCGSELRAREPFLAQHISQGIWSNVDAQVDNRLLVNRLQQVCQELGVKLLEGQEVHQWWQTSDGKIAVASAQQHFEFDKLLLCPGVPPTSMQEALPYKIYPVRGEMLALHLPPDSAPFLHATVRIRSHIWGNAYLVPKADRILCGSTSEEKGVNQRNSAGGLLEILRKCYAAVPGIYELDVQEIWAGLRPSTLSRQPILDREPGREIYHLNGLFRHGILLGPLMGKAAARLLVHGKKMPETLGFKLP